MNPLAGTVNNILEQNFSCDDKSIQPYDKYDIAQNTGTIHVTQEQPY
jgi:hypothetical protein